MASYFQTGHDFCMSSGHESGDYALEGRTYQCCQVQSGGDEITALPMISLVILVIFFLWADKFLKP